MSWQTLCLKRMKEQFDSHPNKKAIHHRICDRSQSTHAAGYMKGMGLKATLPLPHANSILLNR